jgi:HEAT repeat protein
MVDILRWLQSRPLQDDPQWRVPPSGESRDTWDEWVQKGREIAGIEEGLLTMLAREDDAFIRSAAALALGFVGGVRSAEPLIKALENDEALVAMEAAAALGRLGHTESIEPLCEALQNPDSNVRASASTALGSLGGEKARSCLRNAEKDQDPFVRAAVQEALRRSQ